MKRLIQLSFSAGIAFCSFVFACVVVAVSYFSMTGGGNNDRLSDVSVNTIRIMSALVLILALIGAATLEFLS